MHLRLLTRTLTVLAMVAAPVSVLAQSPAGAPPAQQASQSSGGIGIGAKIGPLFSSISQVGNNDGFDNRTGWIGGLFIGGNRPGIVGVGVDILYARKGTKEKNGSDTLDLDYINVPVYLRINAGSASTNKGIVYGIVGLDLNFLLKAKASDDADDITDDFNRADYGLAVGLGAEITRFVVEARYTKGMGNIAKDKNDPVTKNASFAIMFGVRFH